MTTSELVKQLAQRLRISQRQARELLDLHTQAIIRQMLQGKNVIQRNFGTFGIKEIPARRAYVPAKKTVCDIPAHRRMFFRASNKLKEFVAAWMAP